MTRSGTRRRGPVAGGKTIEQPADSLQVDVRQPPPLISLADTDDTARPRAGARTILPFEPDRLAQPHDLRFGQLRHGLWLHPDVSDGLRAWDHLYKRLGIVLQHLAAHGRTTVVKGCRDGNRGWRRSPLGGRGGMQYYLWWTPRGSPAVGALGLPADAILVRAVRHHDDHAPLAAGSLDDYLPLSAPDDLNEDIAGPPWTAEQIDFVEDARPVRLILGRPGSGKTTVLWKAVEARSGQRVLYLTWSSALTRHAEERFASFAPADVSVTARDFATVVGEICAADVSRQTLAASRARFDAALTRLGRDMAGPWKNRRDALHAELRAILFGRAIPGEEGCTVQRGVARLSDDAYRDLRGDHDGVGPRAAKALLKVARFLPPAEVQAVFPELVASTRAIDRLRDDEIPEGFEGFDRVVVDEIQDLTLLETAVVLDLCRAIARKQGRGPWLLMAGDAGQTVRPTGFDWGPLGDVLARRVGAPAKFHLQEHLRCPSRIAEVVERASERYADIAKGVRPGKQRRQLGGQHVDAHLVHVHVPDRARAVRLLEGLAEADDVVVLAPCSAPPSWVPERLRDGVLTPAEAKGLEYQSVCLLDPGRLLSSLGTEETSYVIDVELDRQNRRTAIDHLRVALSRATETLAFIDVEAGEEDRERSLELLGNAAPYDGDDLLDHLAHADASPEERVLARTNDARALVDSAPGRAWQRACQAIRLLGDPELPNGVADAAMRQDAHTTLLGTAARLLVVGMPEGLARRDVVHTVVGTLRAEPVDGQHSHARSAEDETAVAEMNRRIEAVQARSRTLREEAAFLELAAWSADRPQAPFALLEAARDLGAGPDGGGGWLQAALLPAAQALREGLEEGAADPARAGEFATSDVETWLQITGYAGDAAARARALRRKAFDTLIRPRGRDERRPAHQARLAQAESVLERIAPDPLRLGRLREAQEQFEEAARAYERAGARKDVLRVWRNAGAWERAVGLAKGDVRADLDWLIEFERLVERRPAQQNVRLRNGERDRLELLLDVVQKRPPRKRGKGKKDE